MSNSKTYFAIIMVELVLLYVIRWAKFGHNLWIKGNIQFRVNLRFMTTFLVLKLVAFLLLQPSFLFEFRLLHTSIPSLHTTSLTLAFCTVVCCSPMPPRRESLASVKTRLAREQKIRTDRRVSDLLHPRHRASDIEVFDDSEEEDRIASRRARGLGVPAN